MRHARLAALLLSSLAAVGCRSPSDPFGFRSGSRLKAKYIEGGGTTVFTTFHDSARNEDCAFGTSGVDAMVGPGGVTYCLPIAQPERRGFADAKCTERLVEVPEGSTASVVVDAPDRNCEQFPTLYGLGDPYQGLTYDLDFDGNCYATGALDHPVRRVGAELSRDDFVRAEETRESAGDRLEAGASARPARSTWTPPARGRPP